MSDVARQAGVGVATVDRVLNRRAPVRADTERKVLEAAQALGFALEKFRIFAEVSGSGRAVTRRRMAFVLLKQVSRFYHELSISILGAARSSSVCEGDPEIVFLEHESPHQVADLLHELGKRVEAIALVTLDHPVVNQAIDALSQAGVRVYSVITDVTASHRAGYIGVDNRKAGRTAAWAISRMSQRPGKVGILIGDHRFLCQELCEISFRSYFRERANRFQVLEPELSLERPDQAYAVTAALLEQHPDLVGIYISGGGVEGMIEALKHSGRQDDIVAVCHDLTETTRAALAEGVLDLVISHPRDSLARALVEAMGEAPDPSGSNKTHVQLLPFEIVVAESL
ncbi:LacI family DNA-binding transcriptional regulator [Azotobacter salinestris]|uniref:LacI family DNA-binding transcriptional regulator n=1 Tax=Azotobacter salinestris TaxID=69964 RepID=UPI0032DFE670